MVRHLYLILFLTYCVLPTLQGQMQKLRIAENNRFLVLEDQSPFVWMGDTQWFFAKLPPKTIDQILDRRHAQGFTIMQVSCREDLYNGSGPGKTNQPNEAWWSYLDTYIQKCADRGIYVGLTLGWWSIAFNHTDKELYQYGKWVGNRYRNANNIVWMTLGEAGSHLRKKRSIPFAKIKSLVQGIRDGDSGNKLLTIHADYQRGTSLTADAELCDFNNWQTSQWCCVNDLPRQDYRNWTVWDAISYDYDQIYDGKPKPTLDAEAWYENNKDFCGATPFEIRRRAYFTIFAGAFGHTYGAGGLWDGLSDSVGCSQSALRALDYRGVQAMSILSNFLHRLGSELLKLRPARSLIVSENLPDYDRHIQASMSSDQNFALIYTAGDGPFKLDLSQLARGVDQMSWFNPRNNEYHPVTLIDDQGNLHRNNFDPPGSQGPGMDWILVLGNEEFFTSQGIN